MVALLLAATTTAATPMGTTTTSTGTGTGPRLMGIDGSFPPADNSWRFGIPQRVNVTEGDVLVFSWSEMELSVARVETEQAWAACDWTNETLVRGGERSPSGNLAVATAGMGGRTLWFFCDLVGFCEAGLKVAVHVEEQPQASQGGQTAAPTAAVTLSGNSTTPTSMAPTTTSSATGVPTLTRNLSLIHI